jgi:hypothetical protein
MATSVATMPALAAVARSSSFATASWPDRLGQLIQNRSNE